jgi:hypothetical protein
MNPSDDYFSLCCKYKAGLQVSEYIYSLQIHLYLSAQII